MLAILVFKGILKYPFQFVNVIDFLLHFSIVIVPVKKVPEDDLLTGVNACFDFTLNTVNNK